MNEEQPYTTPNPTPGQYDQYGQQPVPSPVPTPEQSSKNPLKIAAVTVSVLLLVVAATLTTLSFTSDKKAPVATNSTDATSQLKESVDTQEGAAAEVAQLNIGDAGFSPSTIKVTPGATVEWTNGDKQSHKLVSDDFGSDNVLQAGDKFSYSYTQPGDYTFNDGAGHTGTVIVRE